MKISKTTAMKIVSDLLDTILQSINLMDERGVIIASTDESCLGIGTLTASCIFHQ